jgi:hypothetical protein
MTIDNSQVYYQQWGWDEQYTPKNGVAFISLCLPKMVNDMVFFEKYKWYSVGEFVRVAITRPFPFYEILPIRAIYEYKWREPWFIMECPDNLKNSYREKRLNDIEIYEISKISKK